MPTPKLTNEVVVAAILGFEEQKRRIDAQIADLRQMLTDGVTAPVVAPEAPRRGKRKMSAAGRKAIAEAQRKRRAASKGVSEAVASKPKRKLSAAGKAAIVAALKKRWAAKRAAAATQSVKKTAVKQ